MSQREYTRQDVINQCLVAFGQGTQFMRVSTRACRLLVDRVGRQIDEKRVTKSWGSEAAQALERIRAMGRLAALMATQDAETTIDHGHVAVAFRRVSATSKTMFCPDDGDDGGDDGGDAQPADLP